MNFYEDKKFEQKIEQITEYTIEIFQWKKTKKMAVVEFQTDENGWEVVRW